MDSDFRPLTLQEMPKKKRKPLGKFWLLIVVGLGIVGVITVSLLIQ